MTGPVMTPMESHDFLASVAKQPSLTKTLSDLKSERSRATEHYDRVAERRLEAAIWHLTRLQMIMEED